MIDENTKPSLWIQIKFHIFLKLGFSLLQYVIFHGDYWKRPYGISFTGSRDFIKRIKYDLSDMDDDLEVEIEKQK